MLLAEEQVTELRRWVEIGLSKSRFRFKCPSTRADVIQHVWVEAWKAAERYVPGRCTLHTYVYRRINGAICDYVRKNTGALRRTGKPRLPTVQLGWEHDTKTTTDHVPEWYMERARRAIMELRLAKKSNSLRDNMVMASYMLDGLTLLAISKLWRLTEGRVLQIVQQHKQRVEEAILEEFA
jgi:RNA polymerase sigma factor (sigma-70 family)